MKIVAIVAGIIFSLTGAVSIYSPVKEYFTNKSIQENLKRTTGMVIKKDTVKNQHHSIRITCVDHEVEYSYSSDSIAVVKYRPELHEVEAHAKIGDSINVWHIPPENKGELEWPHNNHTHVSKANAYEVPYSYSWSSIIIGLIFTFVGVLIIYVTVIISKKD